MTEQVIKIGNAQGFWGDRVDAAAELVRAQPDLDYLTLDYLAEVSMSILARQRERDASLGYARDFVDALRLLAPHWPAHRLRIVTNAGGLNPHACAEVCREVLREAGCRDLRIGVISGDDVLPTIRDSIESGSDASDFAHLETGQPITEVIDKVATANAYLGAEPVVEALRQDADIVITGRVADPSLTVAPCVHHFNWQWDDYDKLAGATIAGHLIECGTQVTGGISTDWLDVPDAAKIGFPVVEVDAEGGVIVTKPAGTGGCVNERTVKEQLLYEIGDPDNYLSPDATVSFLSLAVDDLGSDRVRVTGAVGQPPPSTYKVSATYFAGYRATGELTMFGPDAKAKAERCGQIVIDRLRAADCKPARSLIEAIAGDYSASTGNEKQPAALLRISIADARRETVSQFTRELMPLVTTGPQGTTGYAQGRPRMQEVYGYWPCLLDCNQVTPHVDIVEV